jgi:GT2 family glycosyltransferase
MTGLTPVSILLPVLNEEAHLERCLNSLLAQDYPAIEEILVIDGGSTDGTVEIIDRFNAADGRVRLVVNPDRLQSHGLNRALRIATGRVVVRVDAHTEYAADYVTRSIELLDETSAWAAGGPMVPRSDLSGFAAAVALAMQAKWAAGPAGFRSQQTVGPVDTVYLGAFAREALDRVGGYRSFPSGVAEDADLCDRIRAQGGVVMLSPRISSRYSPRTSPGGLWRQYFRYGSGKAEMIRINRRLPSWRPLAPAALVIGIAGTAVAAAWGGPPLLPLLLVGGWLLSLLALSAVHGRRAPGVALAAAIMHLSYGLGFWRGLLISRLAVSATIPDVRRVIPALDPAGGDPDRNPQQRDEHEDRIPEDVTESDPVTDQERDGPDELGDGQQRPQLPAQEPVGEEP